MIDIKEFKMPTEHPYGMLEGYSNGSEKEDMLAYALSQCITMGGWSVFSTEYNHPDMVGDGLLESVGGNYKLTEKAIGLLYSVYHK